MAIDRATPRTSWRAFRAALAVAAAVVGLSAARGEEGGWIDLIDAEGFAAWKPPTGAWAHATAVRVDPKKDSLLAPDAGPGPILVNGPTGKTRNIVTKRSFGDVELHAEFLIPKKSNSGIKFAGLYEVQIFDSHGVAIPKATHSGGIYPRAELLPTYRYVDDGFPPKVNAAKPAGEWQTLDVIFRAPKFDASGKKTADARFDKVVLNGRVVQENVAVPYPTGHAWHNKEVPTGPILLQADHGPVAFRNLRVRPLPSP